MTLKECRDQIRQNLAEKPGGGFWLDAELNSRINFVNRAVYRSVCKLSPDQYARFTNVTVTDSGSGVAISGATYLNATPYRILNVSFLPGGTTLSVTNTPYPIDIVDAASLDRDQINDVRSLALPARFRCALQGGTFYLRPLGQSAALRIQWLPLPRTLSGDTDTLLTSLSDGATDVVALSFHDMVLTWATRYSASKERRTAEEWKELFDDVRQELRFTDDAKADKYHVTYEDPY